MYIQLYNQKSIVLPIQTKKATDILLNMDEFRRLNEDDLKHLTNALIPVKDKWREIGVELKLPHGELTAILNDPRNHTEVHYLTAMLSLWLNRLVDPPQTWPVIVEALRSRAVNRADIAEQIRNEYCPSAYRGEILSLSLPPPPVVSEFWCLKYALLDLGLSMSYI